jgi:predicted nucleic acid-binding protein
MTTSIDTNVIVALWEAEDEVSKTARDALDESMERGGLVISGVAYAELLAAPGRIEEFLDEFCENTGIEVDWEMGEAIWRAAGGAFQSYAARRKRTAGAGPRRILADFLIGAHALVNEYRLLTLDEKHYRSSFPGLRTVSV